MGRRIKKPKQKSTRAKLKEWSKTVRDRDNHTCQICGITQAQLLATGKKSYLNAHHILFKERYPECKTEPNNGITVCAKCHKFGRYSFHRNPTWGTLWLQKNKPEQFKWIVDNMGDRT